MKPSEITVELKPHIGLQPTDAGPIEVKLPQSVIFVNDVWSGYIADAPGSHISLIRKYPPEVVEVIKQRVDELRGNVSKTVAEAKDVRESASIKPSDVPTVADVTV